MTEQPAAHMMDQMRETPAHLLSGPLVLFRKYATETP
jgi:hypothetical protein